MEVRDQKRTDSQLACPSPSKSDVPDGRLRRFSLVFAQLILILVVVYFWEIEERRQFFALMCTAVGGFLVHAWLPLRLRLAFFAFLSMGTIVFVLGLVNGAWALAIGAGLIAISYLRIRFTFRVALLAIISVGLVYLRRQEPSLGFWPILGSMFMFRLIVYLYDIRNANERPPLFHTLSYFFLLPNACFPLFPVVDYRTFRESYYSKDEWSIYQQGVTWIVRGIIHLLLYRYIKFYLIPAPYELTDLPHVALFMATNYALYLRVSGEFHLITGILHLFGFNLPRSHFLYFLASSVSDIWRRINIYWKDFMMKVFFFPTFFFLRNRGVRAGIASVVAVLVVFVCTWLLHSWQMFWLRGEFPLSSSEAALWLIAGTLVALNSWFEYRKATRPVKQKERSWLFKATTRSLQTILTFATVSLFWACWTRPGFEEILWELLRITPTGLYDVWLAIATVSTLVCIGVAAQLFRRAYPADRFGLDAMTLSQSTQFNGILLAALVMVALPGFGRVFDARIAEAMAEFRSDSLTPLEVANGMHGYYEELNDAVTQAGPFLSSLQLDKQEGLPATEYTRLVRRADPLLDTELIPGVRGELSGSPISINRFGMRDRQTITLRKPAQTTRIVMVGSSVVMGYGVNDDESFGLLLEAKLNSGRALSAKRYEILNFGIGKGCALRRLVQIDRKVYAFEPDAIYYFAHQDELLGPIEQLVRLLEKNFKLPYPALQDIVERARINSEMPPGVIQVRLSPYKQEILLAIYRAIVNNCRRRGILPVWIYLPIPGVSDAPEDSDQILKCARQSGFVVLDLTDWSQGHSLTDVKRTREDHHPDGRGHRLIADVLYDALQQHSEALPDMR